MHSIHAIFNVRLINNYQLSINLTTFARILKAVGAMLERLFLSGDRQSVTDWD